MRGTRMSAQSMATASDIREGDRRRWLILSVLVLAQFMVVLDVAIVNVALPTIKNDLHFSEGGLQWVITAYAIVFGGVLLLGGRMADLLDHRRPDAARVRAHARESARLGHYRDDRPTGRLGRPGRRVRCDRDAFSRAVAAAPHLPPTHADCLEHHRPADGSGGLLAVFPAH